MLIFRQLFDPQSSTYTYLLGDSASRAAVLIDPVFEQVRRDAALVGELGLTLVASLETHVHADHVTGASLLPSIKRPARMAIFFVATCFSLPWPNAPGTIVPTPTTSPATKPAKSTNEIPRIFIASPSTAAKRNTKP